MELQLRISGYHYKILKKHLLTEDGRESVAVALCGRFTSENITILTVHEITLIPHEECISREEDILKWPTQRVIPYFERIGKYDLALLKIHSHPGGYDRFSDTDDFSDREFFDSAFGWATNDKPHASAVMLPGGRIFGRIFFKDLSFQSIDRVLIAGDQLHVFESKRQSAFGSFAQRTIQAFGEHTHSVLQNLTIAVIGCSGTGSPLIEQLVRLGIKKIILIDPDIIELKNLNRILNSTMQDALDGKSKVETMMNAIQKIGIGTEVIAFQKNLYDSIEVLRNLITCDFIFGCMDSVDGRYLLNQLCTFYLIPYIDIGVKLEADGNGGINKICGSVHYLQPGMSSLLSRGVFTLDDLRAASQLRRNPDEYEKLRKNAYIKNVNVNSPAVISVNMHISSHAVNEFLNRLHPYKVEPPANYAVSTIDISEGYIVNVNEADLPQDKYLRNKTGRGDVIPFIEIPEIQ